MDQDYLQSCLQTYYEAKHTQDAFRQRHLDTAKNFFKPKMTKKPNQQTTPSSQTLMLSCTILSHSSEETDSSYSDTFPFHTSDTLDLNFSSDDTTYASSEAPSDIVSPNSVLDGEDASLDSVLLPVFP
jgi:hypothetical protein